MKIIVAIACGVLSSIMFIIVGAQLIPSYMHLTYSIQLPVLLLLGIFGPFIAGFISKNNGWLVGSVTVVITEIFHVLCILWFVTKTFSPSHTVQLTTSYMIKREIQLYICSGTAVFMGALMGSLGEIVGSRKRGKQR